MQLRDLLGCLGCNVVWRVDVRFGGGGHERVVRCLGGFGVAEQDEAFFFCDGVRGGYGDGVGA